MKYSYAVRLRSKNWVRSEEYYFDEYKDAWKFMLRCKDHGSKCELEEVDFITVKSEPYSIKDLDVQ